MTNPTTAAERLAIPEDKLGAELAEVLTPGPWEHDWAVGGCFTFCKKCQCNMIDNPRHSPCPVPDPIDINNWNVAMEWRDWITCKITPSAADEIFSEISKIENKCFVYGAEPTKWWLWNAQPRHYLIAAALAAGKNGT